ncbi:exonuclease domain-containing protein [Arenibacter certesii]|uniref:Exonuclease n=1 Tax=Arenibacter certesii TaxID=228955 RepID=A0A918MG78_9FLAO|nr:exonuclease domain-containing protein [Arenibacter certesii]GGW22408.1 exonuclease [Arenibacter certesii]
MYAIVHIATTGLRGENNKITEICILIHDGIKVVDRFSTLVNPEIPISFSPSLNSEISDEMLLSAPKFYEIAKRVVELTQDCIIISHFVKYTHQCLKNEFTSLGGEFKRSRICTARLSRKLIPGQQSYSLGAMCSHMGINFCSTQGAEGSAEATLALLEKLWKIDKDSSFQFLLRTRTTKLVKPPLWPKSTVNELPNATGVYYFKNSVGEIIYIGKAKDIKQRVLSHSYSKEFKELRLCFETAQIEYRPTGSELVAFLLESDEIKKHFPKYNRAQKRSGYRYGIGTYIDKNGIENLSYDRLNNLKTPIFNFYSQAECRAYLEEFCKDYNLCPKYCKLQNGSGACFHFHLKSCNGVCIGAESVQSYNKRVEKALEQTVEPYTSYIIKDEGRHKDEKSFVMVENGVYKGFGYLPKKKNLAQFEEYVPYIIRMQDNNDVHKILRRYLRQKDNKSIVLEPTQKILQ